MSDLIVVRWLSACVLMAMSAFFVVMNTVSAIAAGRARLAGKSGPSMVPLISLAAAACAALAAPRASIRWLAALLPVLDPGNVALLAVAIRRIVVRR
jgi:hypothetical protein